MLLHRTYDSYENLAKILFIGKGGELLTNKAECGTGALWGIPVAISALGQEGLVSFGDPRAFPEFSDAAWQGF